MQNTISIKNHSCLNDNSKPWGDVTTAVSDFIKSKKDFIKFVSSSFSSYVVEYGLYAILVAVTGNLVPSNVTARILSSAMNYWVNRTFVFHHKDNMLKSAVKYFLLALIIMCGNTLVLNFLVNGLGINRMIAKIMTDLSFFIVNWTIQRLMVFKIGERVKEPALANAACGMNISR